MTCKNPVLGLKSWQSAKNQNEPSFIEALIYTVDFLRERKLEIFGGKKKKKNQS